MLIKARALARDGKDPREIAHTLVERGRRAILAAGGARRRAAEELTVIEETHRPQEPARPPRPRRGEARPHGGRLHVAGSRSRSDGDEVDGKSILGLLLLAAGKGTSLVVRADGPDEKAALVGGQGPRRPAVRRERLGRAARATVESRDEAGSFAHRDSRVARRRRRAGRRVALPRGHGAAPRPRARGGPGRRWSASGAPSSRPSRRSRATAAQVSERLGPEYAAIFQAHALFLKDTAFLGPVEKRITQETVNAEWAVAATTDALVARFRDLPDEDLALRATDLDDVARIVLKHLGDEERQPPPDGGPGRRGDRPRRRRADARPTPSGFRATASSAS